MVFRRFYLVILFRIILLAVNALLVGYFFFRPVFIFTSIFLSAVFVIQVILLVLFLNRINTQLATFANYLENDDPQISFRENGSMIRDRQLYKYFRHLSDIISEYRTREKRWQYLLDYTIENLDTGIIVLNDTNQIEIVNKPAKRLINLRNEKYIENIPDADPGLIFAINAILPGQRKIYKFRQKDDLRHLLLKCARFRLYNEQLKLVSMQDIRNELQDKELESWQKLIRVMTHEVNNTISPVTSLTTLLLEKLETHECREGFSESTSEICRKTIEGLSIINERNAGLLRFVNEFRTSTLPPQIAPEHFRVHDLLMETATLFSASLNDNRIHLECHTEPSGLSVFADKKLLSQVLINLVKNGIECFEHTNIINRRIVCAGTMDETDRVVIEVADNGPGMTAQIADKIFIPFFTTREQGNGIGLSFSRQVVRRHRGTIEVFTEPGSGSRFIIKI